MSQFFSRRAWCGAIALAALSAAASANPVFVDAKSNIYGWGVGTPAPGGGGGGLVAVTISLPAGTGRTMTFNASGIAGWNNLPFNGPDGGNFAPGTNISALGPISNYTAPLSGHLVGLFLDAADPSASPAPAGLSYPDLASLAATSYSPGLQQVFFIGDGLTGTGSGTAQVFNIPDSATRLVLGIADGFGFANAPGFYDDNVGGYDVSYSIVPSPSAAATVVMLAAGIARRRRSK